jgi:hypothetical protein
VSADQLSFWESSEETTATRKRRRPAKTRMPAPEVSRTVGTEILHSQFNPSIWAVALAQSSGSHQDAVASYARIRLELLSSEVTDRKQKLAALETRRLAGFQKAPETTPQTREKNHRRTHRLHPVWLASWWLGMSGASSCLALLLPADSVPQMLRNGLGAHLVFSAALVCLAVTIHHILPISRQLIRRFLPFVAWSSAAASLYLGIMTLQRGSLGQLNLPENTTRMAESSPTPSANPKLIADSK